MTTTDARGARRVVVCADDFAVHEPASRGIAALAGAGRLSATSVMVLSPRWAADAQLLAPLRDRIDVGLHLDWTSEFAHAAGWGVSLGAAMLRAVTGGFDAIRARRAIDTQLDRFEAHWGAPPDHVDGHQHVHQFAGIRQALVAALQARYAARRPWVRVARPAADSGFKGRVIGALGAAALSGLARAAGLPCSRELSGLYGFDEAGYGRRMQAWLAQAGDGTVIMCHPAEALAAGDGIAAARVREFRWLDGPDWPQALVRSGAVLARGRELFGVRA